MYFSIRVAILWNPINFLFYKSKIRNNVEKMQNTEQNAANNDAIATISLNDV